MKRLLFLMVTLFWLVPEGGMAQISILPEIGISYLPFTLHGSNTVNESNRIDGLFGLSAQLPIHEKWYFNTRISYANRENMKWSDLCFCPGFLYHKYIHSDINFDFTFMLNLGKLSLGLDPSITRKFGELISVYKLPENVRMLSGSGNIFAINSRLSISTINNLYINISYNRILTNLYGIYSPDGQNRLDLTLSYHLFGGDKGKKR